MKEHVVTMTTHAPIRTPDVVAGPDRSGSSHKSTLREHQCLRCAHRWWPRSPTRTLRCPRCKSPYWDRPRRTDPPARNTPRVERGAVIAASTDTATGTVEPLSFANALELLRGLKAMGRSWTEMGHELHRQCGVHLDKDQLKALVR
jgi:hypothetical protein